MAWLAEIVRCLRPPELSGPERHTYVRHLWFDLLASASAGILANAPAIALKSMGSPPWALSLRLGLSSVGMLAALYLGGWMARRRKMPFVLAPGLGFAACSAAMAFTREPLAFLTLFGVGAVFEMVARPAVTAVLRLNYAPRRRGEVIGHVRAWCALTFLGSHLAAAALLRSGGGQVETLICGLMLLAAGMDLASLAVFRRIRVRETALEAGPIRPRVVATLAESCGVVARDRRFRRYLAGCFLFGFSGLMYVEFVPAVLQRGLGCGYIELALLTHVIPGVAQFVTTGWWGRRLDRSTPNAEWGWIRLGWGLDPILLAAAPLAAAVAPAAAFALAGLGRISRGAVMGASWVLWWRVGIAHFAPPGGDTTRYMGILTFLNGLMRLAAAVAGSLLLVHGSAASVLLIGGAGVLASGWYSRRLASRERLEKVKPTIAEFEGQFP
jgi:MFS family permease